MRDYDFYYTQDGSIGLYSYADDDVYHSKFGALTEAWEKFVLPSGIESILNTQENIRVLDVCYGIGYNTKALMSFIINKNNKILKKENFIKKFLKKLKNNFQKNNNFTTNNETIDSNNILIKKEMLLEYSETLEQEKISKIDIDCLEIKTELVKLSPLLKTVITPQEIFTRIVPKFLDCFDWYWKIKNFLAKLSYKFSPTNNINIKERLDLKFNNDYDEIKNEYRIHKFVNYILVDRLIEAYGKNYFDADFNLVLKNRAKKKYFDNAVVQYAFFKQISRHNLLSLFDLSGYLHNIYYDHLSRRYKKAKFKDAAKLFNVNFHVDDARKTIFDTNGQYDLIFLDAFTYSKAPELWSVEFMAELYSRLSPKGMLMTYSNSALVRNTLLENNFYVGKIFDEKTGKYIGTVATKEKNLIQYPLSNYEIGLCNTRAGIPYRDPSLSSTKEQILKRREMEFKTSDLPTSSQYMRMRAASKAETEECNNEE